MSSVAINPIRSATLFKTLDDTRRASTMYSCPPQSVPGLSYRAPRPRLYTAVPVPLLKTWRYVCSSNGIPSQTIKPHVSNGRVFRHWREDSASSFPLYKSTARISEENGNPLIHAPIPKISSTF
ncbi:hypothetical protein TNCV_5038871 [Trichonephila clavipes]|nr:hypothetical protein TNCV_5038871 [Trichonephila clavipes]